LPYRWQLTPLEEYTENESASIRKEDLQQMQNHSQEGNRQSHLREQEAQTKTRIEEDQLWHE
jgi:hypothetical protein